VNLGPAEIGLVVLAVMLLFGYKKLPDASRSLGRSLRIFKGEMNDLRDDAGPTPGTDSALTTPSAAPSRLQSARTTVTAPD
jgi:sec-independent protein translocase protein TatA